MGTTTGLVTVAEFERMPNHKYGWRQELRHGEVVDVPPPKPTHQEIQYRMARAIEAIASADWKVRVEMAFRPQAEYEVWVADVGVMSRARWEKAVADNVYPLGAPEVIIEVLSPSNRASEMVDREQTCLGGGCKEFWVVDPETRQIRVTTAEHAWRTYAAGEAVPVLNQGIAIDEIFTD